MQKAHEELKSRLVEQTAKLIKANKKLESEIKDRKLTEENLKITLRELQETKDMLIQVEKLAAIGRLTASCAHEILNHVNIISTRLHMLDDSTDVSDTFDEVLPKVLGMLAGKVKSTKDGKTIGTKLSPRKRSRKAQPVAAPYKK